MMVVLEQNKGRVESTGAAVLWGSALGLEWWVHLCVLLLIKD